MKKLLGVGVLVGIIFLSGCSMGNITVEDKDHVSFTTSTYVSDYNYEPDEVDLFQIVVSAFHDADMGKWGNLDDRFLHHQVPETMFAELYGANQFDSEDIEKFTYDVKDKKFSAYLEEKPVDPIDIDTSNGVEWATFPYDTWIEFSFDLTRHAHYKSGKVVSDSFHVEGNMPPNWLPDQNETHWYIGEIWVTPEK